MKASKFIERLEYLIKQYGDLNLSDCFDYVIGFIYHYEIWDKGTRYEEKFESFIVQFDVNPQRPPLKSSEICTRLKELIAKHGDLMVVFQDDCPVVNIMHAPKENDFYIIEV